MNEIETIRRARQGDEAAWRVLVHNHQTAVFRLAYLLLGDPDEAEDVAQETLIRAYRHLARFDETRPLRPWLLQITRRQAANQRRSVRRYLAAVTRWWQNRGAQEALPVDTVADTMSNATLLWQAVRTLSKNDQEVIYLRHFLELSVIEAAEALGVAEGTVKSRLARAMARLRTVIETEYPGLPHCGDDNHSAYLAINSGAHSVQSREGDGR